MDSDRKSCKQSSSSLITQLLSERQLNSVYLLLFSLVLQPSAGYCLLVPRSFLITHNDAPQSKDSSGRVISPSQRLLPDNTQHTQQTNIHAPSGIRTHDRSSRQAAVDLRLRRRGHWDRQLNKLRKCNSRNFELQMAGACNTCFP
jgi:hypothetical protein